MGNLVIIEENFNLFLEKIWIFPPMVKTQNAVSVSKQTSSNKLEGIKESNLQIRRGQGVKLTFHVYSYSYTISVFDPLTCSNKNGGSSILGNAAQSISLNIKILIWRFHKKKKRHDEIIMYCLFLIILHVSL